MADDLQAQLLAFRALAMVLAGEGHQGFGQADNAHAEGAVLEDFTHRLVHIQLFAVDPHALAHKEGVIAALFGGLDLEAVEQLADDQVDLLVQHLVEAV